MQELNGIVYFSQRHVSKYIRGVLGLYEIGQASYYGDPDFLTLKIHNLLLCTIIPYDCRLFSVFSKVCIMGKC